MKQINKNIIEEKDIRISFLYRNYYAPKYGSQSTKSL